MALPGFTASRAIGARARHYRTGAITTQTGTSIRPQQEHRSLVRPLLGSSAGAHTYDCTSVPGCAQLIWSGACADAGLTTVCVGDGCWC